jgi:hypothetical protein
MYVKYALHVYYIVEYCYTRLNLCSMLWIVTFSCCYQNAVEILLSYWICVIICYIVMLCHHEHFCMSLLLSLMFQLWCAYLIHAFGTACKCYVCRMLDIFKLIENNCYIVATWLKLSCWCKLVRTEYHWCEKNSNCLTISPLNCDVVSDHLSPFVVSNITRSDVQS